MCVSWHSLCSSMHGHLGLINTHPPLLPACLPAAGERGAVQKEAAAAAAGSVSLERPAGAHSATGAGEASKGSELEVPGSCSGPALVFHNDHNTCLECLSSPCVCTHSVTSAHGPCLTARAASCAALAHPHAQHMPATCRLGTKCSAQRLLTHTRTTRPPRAGCAQGVQCADQLGAH